MGRNPPEGEREAADDNRIETPAMDGGRRLDWRAVVVFAAALPLAAIIGAQVSERPQQRWPSYADVFEGVASSVVNVSIEGRRSSEGEQRPSTRVGSGFAVSGDEIVTARHLVLDAEQVLVRDRFGRTLPAVVVGSDARTDLALLAAPGAGFPAALLGDSEEARVGDTVIAIGNPYGLAHSLSVGVIGGLGRRLLGEGGPKVDFLQLSIPLNPGNSGGPIFDGQGRVIGVLSGTHAQGQAIAFAVPTDALRESLPKLRAGQRVSRAFLGASVEQQGDSAIVIAVIASSPADIAGIRVGDKLSAVGGVPVRTPEDLVSALDALSGGERASVRLMRDGALVMLDVTLSDWAEQPVVIGGMTLRPAPGAGGEVVAVRPSSRAERAGVSVGDIVRAVDGMPVRAPADIRDALVDGASAQLDLVRAGVPLSVQLGGPL